MVLLQLVGQMVRNSQSSRIGGYDLPPMTRHYARVNVSRFAVELEPVPELRVIKATIHATNASGIMVQVRGSNETWHVW